MSLLVAAAVVVFATAVAVRDFPAGLSVLACIALAARVGWFGVVRRGWPRRLSWTVAVLLLAAAVALLIAERSLIENLVVVVGALVALGAAGAAFSIRVPLPRGPQPKRPVVFMNPRAGGGKVDRFDLPDEARARGIEAVLLGPDDDLATLVRDAIARGADALGMAGGDGSQAPVVALAAEHRLPYACIPAGTRNHFARDLGVDRRDVVGALDALVDGGERVVDLAEVNGTVFVNNVSIGVYGDAVERAGYRSSKLRTLLDTVPDVLGPGGEELALEWVDRRGRLHGSGAAIVVSNNRYRLAHLLGAGTRPRLDGGVLGIAIVASRLRQGDARRPWEQWSQPTFEVRSGEPVAAGVDGEAVSLQSPIRFRSVAGALRVRIARSHPGASPSVAAPYGARETIRQLVAIALGRPAPAGRRG
jgi:diacylglycerol kinase family enzyme